MIKHNIFFPPSVSKQFRSASFLIKYFNIFSTKTKMFDLMSGVDIHTTFATPAWRLLYGLPHHPVDESRSLRARRTGLLWGTQPLLTVLGANNDQPFNTGIQVPKVKQENILFICKWSDFSNTRKISQGIFSYCMFCSQCFWFLKNVPGLCHRS